MSLAEMLVILSVSLMVFGPKKLPMLARHLGFWFGKFRRWQEQWHTFWQMKTKEIELFENEKKAEISDALYQKSKNQQEQE